MQGVVVDQAQEFIPSLLRQALVVLANHLRRPEHDRHGVQPPVCHHGKDVFIHGSLNGPHQQILHRIGPQQADHCAPLNDHGSSSNSGSAATPSMWRSQSAPASPAVETPSETHPHEQTEAKRRRSWWYPTHA